MKCIKCGKILTGKQTKFCSTICKSRIHNVKLQSYAAQRKRGVERKASAIAENGGKCTVCGYDKNTAAMCFHHLKDKKFPLDTKHFANNSMETIRKELEKCELLCLNCHMELHYPECDN